MKALLLFAAAAAFGRESWIASRAHSSGEVRTVLPETTRLKEIL